MELLARVNFVLQSAAHNLFPNFFDAFYEELLEVVAFDACVGRLTNGFALHGSFSVYYVFEGTD